MVDTTMILGIVSIIFGALVLALPKFLRFVVGIYFVVYGILLISFGYI